MRSELVAIVDGMAQAVQHCAGRLLVTECLARLRGSGITNYVRLCALRTGGHR